MQTTSDVYTVFIHIMLVQKCIIYVFAYNTMFYMYCKFKVKKHAKLRENYSNLTFHHYRVLGQ